jgi:Zn-finger nucleic acid-binding protein
MAQCPQCADSPLVHAMLTEGLAGYSCGNCLGTLVSLVSYRAWRERAGANALPSVMPAFADTAAADSIGAKKCPKCRSLMSKYRISAERANRLDYCAHCEEIWLDDGEWQLVESLVMSGEFSKVFTQVWQSAVRTEITGAMEDQRLRELLGQDFGRFSDFAAWLAKQPARHEILAQLARHR